ncbi:solute carrier family 23 member 2-like [Antedon mediterranea]|uniref:solute carrier family 23 member 2-like n=1 Tax=Antedon mediterranea TaxID=105859 RepID=UPI003AF98B28
MITDGASEALNTTEKNGAAAVDVEAYPTKNGTVLGNSKYGKSNEDLISTDSDDVTYKINDVPPWYTTVLLGLQHFMTMFGSCVSIPLILAPALCIGDDLVATSEIIGTIFFVSGLVTILQTTFGVRLPIVQGGTFAFLTPTFAILSLQGDCPAPPPPNATEAQLDEATEVWQVRMREIQGAIIVASIFQVVIGFSGIMGFVLKYIGPLAIAPTIGLVGLSLYGAAASRAGVHWGMSVFTIFLVLLFSQYLKNMNVPTIGYNSSDGCHVTKYPFFKLFPIILAIVIAWIFSAIFTATDVFPTNSTSYGYGARTDVNTEVLNQAPWFRFPYPGQWGAPVVTVAGVFGMLSGVLASMVESVGDYYACARLSGAPPPPDHAINRGIGIEGIGCILAGLWGTGNGTTSYSENIGAIGITKVGSRLVVQVAGIIMMLLGVFGKFGALFVALPDPIIGGVFCVMFGMVTGVGLSNLQFANMNSSRNIFIIGFSLLMGLALPWWFADNPGIIQTGVDELDQIITVLLSTSMFVGGFIGFLLDNTIPGTDEERGLTKWRRTLSKEIDSSSVDDDDESVKTYDMPIGMKFIRSRSFFSYLPFCPTFPAPAYRSATEDGVQGELSVDTRL